MTPDQLRTAFRELNGQRDVKIEFVSGTNATVPRALLVPAEEDNIVKLTDGSREFLIDAERVLMVEIG